MPEQSPNPANQQHEPALAPLDASGERRRFKHKPPEGLVPGTIDSLPDRQPYLDWVRWHVESASLTHELKRIETPILEKVATVSRALGAENDVTEEQLMRVSGRGGDAVCLRPDVRPGIARAFAMDKFSGVDKPVRLWHRGPVFRNVPLVAGSSRQFEVFGIELIGEKNPVLDAQVIEIAWKMVKHLGLQNIQINVNSVGCLDCRPEYLQQLKEHFESRQNALCKACRKRRTTNPMRLLACQEEKCQRNAKDAPQVVDHLCEACHAHFTEVLEFLDDLDVPYTLNPQLVHEVDYYTRTVFAFWPEKGDRSKALFTGGRYDDLIEAAGGRPTPAVGITGGVERLVLALQEQAIKVPAIRRGDVYLAQLSAMAKKRALKVFDQLREAGIRVVEGFGKNAITTQVEQATKMGVPITLILGQKETLEDSIILRDMVNGVQEIVSLAKLIPELKKRLAAFGPSLDRAVPTPAEVAAANAAKAPVGAAAGAAAGANLKGAAGQRTGGAGSRPAADGPQKLNL
ncbi:MAG: histidine--tRNA ligase [Candidatus Andersenbacteria bacterium]